MDQQLWPLIGVEDQPPLSWHSLGPREGEDSTISETTPSLAQGQWGLAMDSRDISWMVLVDSLKPITTTSTTTDLLRTNTGILITLQVMGLSFLSQFNPRGNFRMSHLSSGQKYRSIVPSRTSSFLSKSNRHRSIEMVDLEPDERISTGKPMARGEISSRLDSNLRN